MAKETVQSIILERIEPGEFYQSVESGGWTDSLTGIHVPGPKVQIDPVTHDVIKITELPDPIQIPHLKRTWDLKDNSLKVDDRFDRQDAEALTDGLQLALSVGIIRHVPLHEVEKFYPKAYANRRTTSDPIVFSREKHIVPMADLVRDFQNKMTKAVEGVQEREAVATEKAKRGRPPKLAEVEA
jgi:hypothetical protein